MPLHAHLLLAATALCCFATMFAFPMEGFSKGHHCTCVAKTDTTINPQYFKKIEIVPVGPHCPNVEIIITLRNDKQVCLEPKAKWVQGLVAMVTKRAEMARRTKK